MPRKATAEKTKRAFRGDRLRLIREQMHLTQPDFEKLFGFGAGMVSRYENGAADPLPNQLVEMSRKLEVSADWLLGLSDNPEPDASFKPYEPASPQNAKEVLFLERLRNGDFARLIYELSRDLVVSTEKPNENTPEQEFK